LAIKELFSQTKFGCNIIFGINFFNSSKETHQGLKSITGSTVKSITVDSTQTFASHQSNIKSTLSPKSSFTCFAVVGLGFQDKFAEGAAIGTQANFINSSAI
jgi:hypothetical protein